MTYLLSRRCNSKFRNSHTLSLSKNTNSSMALRQIQRKYSKFISDACKNSSKIGLPRNSIEESDLHKFHCKRSYTYINDDPIPPAPHKYKFDKGEHDDGDQRWFHNPKRVGFTLFFFTCGALLGVASGKSVTVPYSERSHFILFHKLLGKIIPEEHTWFEGEKLPTLHPDSITARRIFQDIFDQALPIEIEIRRSLETENGVAIDVENKEKRWFSKVSFRFKTPGDFGRKQGDLEKANCEIIVLKSGEDACASSGRFGKIYVTTAMLDFYRKHEPMIATKFGIEVGHDLARHNEELRSKFITLVSVIGLILYVLWQSPYIRSKMPSLVNLTRRRFLPSFSLVGTALLLSYPPWAMYHRKLEYEADHIGVMLGASGGYDPVVGLTYPVYRGELKQSVLPEFLSIFPSGRKRNMYLARPQILNEAIYKYRQSAKPSTSTDSTEA